MAKSDPLERRRHKRVRVDVDLFYKVDRPPEIRMKIGDQSKRTGMVNVSEGGIGYVSDSDIPVLTELDITFHLIFKDGHSQEIRAQGQVRYCYPLPEFERYPVYRIGAEFSSIDEKNRSRIIDYIRSSPKP